LFLLFGFFQYQSVLLIDLLIIVANRIITHSGPPLVELLEVIPLPTPAAHLPLRLLINDVYSSASVSLAANAKIEVGRVKKGDRLLVMPANVTCVIK
jgi:translation elongation factor EF-1alpha